MIRRPPRSTRTDTLFPYTTLFRSGVDPAADAVIPWLIGRIGLGADVHPGQEHMRLTVWLSRPAPASANCVDAQGQIFGKGATEGKVGTCSSHHTTALSCGESAR